MKDDNIIINLRNEYNLNVKSIKKVKNTYKVNTDNGEYCLKIIKYQYPHFYFIVSAIKHLQNKGFNCIPEIIINSSNLEYITLGDKYAYLTKWIESRESNYDNPIELKKVIREVARMHELSSGFSINPSMNPRIGWFTWIKTYETRRNEILDFRKRIHQKAHKSEFDNIYLNVMDDELERAEVAIKKLRESNYYNIMEKQVIKRGFCHHDLANHNVLIDKQGNVNFIDFDYCILDSNLHDLSSLLIRNMKNSRWEEKKAKLILDSYMSIKDVSKEEMTVMEGFMRFPQDYWQIGIQYYWEMQPWGEEFFINKLMRYINDRKEREEFLDSFLEIY